MHLARVALVVCSIVGCGGDDGTAGSSSSEGTNDAEASSAAEATSESESATTEGDESGSTGGGRSEGPRTTGATSQEGGDPCDCMSGGYAPVCGVDGMTYDAICGTQCVPVDIECEGECPCSGLMCGELECGDGETICRTTVGGAKGSRPSYQCATVPEACLPNPDCTCFPEIGCTCTEDPEDFFVIECFAP
jgi:hypothetical protein